MKVQAEKASLWLGRANEPLPPPIGNSVNIFQALHFDENECEWVPGNVCLFRYVIVSALIDENEFGYFVMFLVWLLRHVLCCVRSFFVIFNFFCRISF